MIILETTRLTVRQYSMDDINYFFSLNSNAETMKYIRPVRSREECLKILGQIIENYAAHPKIGGWAAFEKETKNYIGSLAIFPIAETEEIQIGYSFLPPYWGKGYATELTKAGINYYFKHHPFDELHAITSIPNIASQKVLLKCGFVENGTKHEGEELLQRFIMQRRSL